MRTPIGELRSRLAQAGAAARASDMSLVVSPGPDLRYLCGYDAIALERMTALVVTGAEAHLVVPELEAPAASASPAAELEITMHTWSETDDPYALIAGLVPPESRVGVEARMWAAKTFSLQAAGVNVCNGDPVLSSLRLVKSDYEIDALGAAGAAIDSVHGLVPELLRVGRTEAQIGADIDAAIRAAGHATVDFVIVASGPNAASPHHAVSDRALAAGDLVVVDIGGTMPSGYCSDSTRTYAVDHAPAAAQAAYDVLKVAQELGVGHVAPGALTEQIDAATREVLAAAGLADLFIHRTGHGIGLETHEAPYLVNGDRTPLQAGMAFSIEPGVYLTGQWGARIEDIVVCIEGGALRLNHADRALRFVSG